MTKKDFYDVLGVEKSASQPEIKKAFKGLAKKYHPDISKEKNAEAMFKEVQEAYAVLSDEQKRAQYDQYGHAAFDQMSGGHGYSDGFDFSDIFSEIFGGNRGFGGFGGGRSADPNGPRHGRDMEINISLSFKDAVFGLKKEISLKREEDCHTCSGIGAKSASDVVTCQTCGGMGKVRKQQQTMFGMAMTEAICHSCHGKGKTIKHKCSKCHGSGRHTYNNDISINFPAGIENGAYMRVTGKGEGGHKGGSDGDLFINVQVQEDQFFKRSGNNIIIEIPIHYTQAALGSEIDVPTIHGDVTLKIPHGTQTGDKLRLKAKGVHGKSKGDQIIIVKIIVPTKLSTKEKEILKDLSVHELKDTHQSNFFDKVKKIFK